MMQWFQQLWHWLDMHTGWAPEIIGAAVILGLTALAHYVWRILHRHVRRGLEKTDTVWDDALWAALSRPTVMAIWVIGAGFALQYALAERRPVIVVAVKNLRSAALIILIGLFLTRFIREAEKHFCAKALLSQAEGRLDIPTINALSRLLKVCVILVMSLIMLDTMGFSIGGVLAFGGIGGLAISFAAKDMLANFFGGLMLYLDRPFAVGDSIRSPDREIEGTVEFIGWRQTRIRTPERRSLYIPNSVFATIALENITRMANRRIHENIGLRYDDATVLPLVLQDLRKMLEEHADLAVDKLTVAFFTQFGDSALNIMINTHTKTTDWREFHRVREDVLLKVLDIIHAHGADIAFPTQTLLLHTDAAAEIEKTAS